MSEQLSIRFSNMRTALVGALSLVLLVAFPLVGPRDAPWRLRAIPLAWKSAGWRTGIVGVLAVGAVGVVALWACLLADFHLTREVYLTASVMSILAEVPFLLRAL